MNGKKVAKYAWVNPRLVRQDEATGFAAAVAGALVGGWLGFNATEGLVALLTTIGGATAAANLTVLGLDIAWDRQARDRFAEAGSKEAEALEARPSTS